MDQADSSLKQENQVMETGVTDLKETCPAFQAGCPFNKPELKEIYEEAKKCPAFKDDCTFKNAKTVHDLHDMLSKIPDLTENSTHQKSLVEILKVIHSVSKELKEQMGDCPVFKSQKGCPFKTVCSDDVPLFEKLNNFKWETVIHSSAIVVGEELVSNLNKETEKPEEKMKDNEQQESSGIKLSSDFKKGTLQLHKQANGSHFIREFMRGKMEQKFYREMVACHYFVYTALEGEMEKHADHPVLGSIHFPKELSRLDTIKEDLKYYYGDDWEDEISIIDSVQAYVDRLHKVAETDPTLLVAHHYTRYLGDLAGGQILKKLAVKFYDLPEDGTGVRFYEFTNIPDVVQFKSLYRSKLDGLDINREVADALVEEANVAFILNIELFKELDRLAGFEEEIVHETVEVDDSKPNVDAIPESQSEDKDAKHVTEPTQSATEKSNGAAGNVVDWLKILAAVMIAIAVLVGVAVKMSNK